MYFECLAIIPQIHDGTELIDAFRDNGLDLGTLDMWRRTMGKYEPLR